MATVIELGIIVPEGGFPSVTVEDREDARELVRLLQKAGVSVNLREQYTTETLPDGVVITPESFPDVPRRIGSAEPETDPDARWTAGGPTPTYLAQQREKKPMSAPEKAAAMRRGEDLRDGYGTPMTKNSRGEWVNEGGDTPCPTDGEMTNKQCWKCGWVRGYGDYRNDPTLENPEDEDGGM